MGWLCLLTLSPAIELDIDMLVDIFGQIEDILLLGLFVRLIALLCTTSTTTGGSSSTTSTTSAATSSTTISAMATTTTTAASSSASEMATFGHD